MLPCRGFLGAAGGVAVTAADSKSVSLAATQDRAAPRRVRRDRPWRAAQGHALRDRVESRQPDAVPSPGDSRLGTAARLGLGLLPRARSPGCPSTPRAFCGRTGSSTTAREGGSLSRTNFDTVHLIAVREQPLQVTAAGGRLAVSGTGDEPDLLQVTYEPAGLVLSHDTCNGNPFGSNGGLIPQHDDQLFAPWRIGRTERPSTAETGPRSRIASAARRFPGGAGRHSWRANS